MIIEEIFEGTYLVTYIERGYKKEGFFLVRARSLNKAKALAEQNINNEFIKTVVNEVIADEGN
jgi:hypothetical protein